MLLSVKRRQNGPGKLAYDAYQRLLAWDVPENEATKLVLDSIHAREVIAGRARAWASSKLLFAPMLRARAERAGRNLNLEQAARVRGSVRLQIGENCTFESFDVQTAAGADRPLLAVGDGCFIGPRVSFVAKRDVIIGSFVHIGRLSSIVDGESPRPTSGSAKAISISDHVWLGNNVHVVEGVHIGRGAVIAPGSLVTTDIPEFALAIGVPARVVGVRPGSEAPPSSPM
jgi:acetyltransferase-like isoleucine patch superfamily enzyme